MWADYLVPTSTATICSGALCIFNYTAQSTDVAGEAARRLPGQRQAVEDRRAVRADRRHRPAQQHALLEQSTRSRDDRAPPAAPMHFDHAAVALRAATPEERAWDGARDGDRDHHRARRSPGRPPSPTRPRARRSPSRAGRRSDAFTLAEAGINNVMAVLNLPTNNALDPDTLPMHRPTRRSTASDATRRISTWRHALRRTATSTGAARSTAARRTWYVTSIGNWRNTDQGQRRQRDARR